MDKSEINLIIESQLHYFKQQSLSLSKLIESFKDGGLGRLAYQQNPSVNKLMESFKDGGLGRLAYQQKLSAALGKNLDITINPDIFLSLERTTRISNLTQSLLLKVDLEAVINSLQLNSNSINPIYKKFLNLSNSYSSLTESANKVILEKPGFIKVISELPALEVLNSLDILETLSVNNTEDNFEAEKHFIRNEVIVEGRIEEILTNTGSGDLIQMWEGAKAVLNSTNNPDYARHFITSLRELLTHFIQRLAPDKEICKWTSSPDDFHDKRPKRRTRLNFICRSINHDNFSNFLKKDIDSTLELIDLFQRGTHKVGSPYTRNQLIALKAKFEGIILFLSETSLLNE